MRNNSERFTGSSADDLWFNQGTRADALVMQAVADALPDFIPGRTRY